MIELKTLQYPIGEFSKPPSITTSIIGDWIADIEEFPEAIKRITKDLTNEQKGWQYRPNGWAITQVVHHCADSHINNLIRFKLSLTEDSPTIRPYYEDRWAELIDATDNNLTDSLLLLTGLHNKWVKLLRSLTAEQLKRTFIHPEHGTTFTVEENIGIYAWHCNHHLAHIKGALEAKGRYNHMS